jgi:hypothetical protein
VFDKAEHRPRRPATKHGKTVRLRGFYEYYAQNRFQGGSFGVNIAKKF